MLTAYKTDIGRTRTINEDCVFVQTELNGLTLAIVADGMGGHQAGDVASKMAIELIQAELGTLQSDMPLEACEVMLKQAFHIANEAIFKLATDKPEFQGMGTTVVLAAATEERIIVANIGDSRAYIMKEGSLSQLTEDHSLVTELVKSGQISVEDSHEHPQRNVLTRALGTEPTANVDFHHLTWQAGDRLLLCSDGLTGLVTDEQIKAILLDESELQQQTDRLIALALEAGGKDNVTVVLLSNTQKREHGVG